MVDALVPSVRDENRRLRRERDFWRDRAKTLHREVRLCLAAPSLVLMHSRLLAVDTDATALQGDAEAP